MCNDYRNRKSARHLVETFSEIKIPLRFSNGIPNIEPRDDIKITDRAPIMIPDGDGARLEMMRWSWPSPKGAPVFNFRSENRTFERAIGGRTHLGGAEVRMISQQLPVSEQTALFMRVAERPRVCRPGKGQEARARFVRR